MDDIGVDDSTDDGSVGHEDSWGDVDCDLEIDDDGNESVCSEPGPYDSPGVTVIQPYQFEPVAEPKGDEEESASCHEQDTNGAYLRDLSLWCKCGNCSLMDTVEESVCCQSINKTRDKCKEVETYGMGTVPRCITEHPGFMSVCLDVWVLQAVYREFRQNHGDLKKPLHERYRYCAYRHLVRWCWGFLGKEHRLPLPSCAVTAIRNKFPPTDGNITGFRYPE